MTDLLITEQELMACLLLDGHTKEEARKIIADWPRAGGLMHEFNEVIKGETGVIDENILKEMEEYCLAQGFEPVSGSDAAIAKSAGMILRQQYREIFRLARLGLKAESGGWAALCVMRMQNKARAEWAEQLAKPALEMYSRWRKLEKEYLLTDPAELKPGISDVAIDALAAFPQAEPLKDDGSCA